MNRKSIRPMNKKGVIGIIIFFVALFLVLMIGFIAAIVVGLIDFAGDEITPVFQDLGVIGATNFSEAAEASVVPLNTLIQALPWLVGFAYVVMLIFSVIFAMSYSFSPNPVYIGFYIMMVLLLIMGAILMSNMYEKIYNGTDVLADRLKEQTILSYMILYSPMIMAIISFITGIYIFTRSGEGGGVGI